MKTIKTLLFFVIITGIMSGVGCGKKKDLTLPAVEVKTYTIVYSLYTKGILDSQPQSEHNEIPVTIVYKNREVLATAQSVITEANNTVVWSFVVEKEIEAFMRVTLPDGSAIPNNLYASAAINTVKKDGGEYQLIPVTTIEKHIVANGTTISWKK